LLFLKIIEKTKLREFFNITKSIINYFINQIILNRTIW